MLSDRRDTTGNKQRPYMHPSGARETLDVDLWLTYCLFSKASSLKLFKKVLIYHDMFCNRPVAQVE